MENMMTGDDLGATKPEDMKTQVKVGFTLGQTIEKLKQNSYQYATAGDTRRLIEEIDRCHARLEIDHAFQYAYGEAFKRIEIPYDERLTFPDKITALECDMKHLKDKDLYSHEVMD
jgi:hypothetical protein